MSVFIGPPPDREPDYGELECICSFLKNVPVIVEPWEDRTDSVLLTVQLMHQMVDREPHIHPSVIKMLQFVSKDSPKKVITVPATFVSITSEYWGMTLMLRAFERYNCVFKTSNTRGITSTDVTYEVYDENAEGYLTATVSRWIKRGGNEEGMSDCDLRVVLDMPASGLVD